MHASSLENMGKCYRRFIAGSALETRAGLKVLDVGGADVNGSYADVFNQENVTYLGADLQAGPGVSVVLDDPNVLPLDDNSVDIVVSGQMLEHCEFFWVAFAEMVRVVKEDGYIFLIAPSAGPIHRYPVDCYRFYPDAYRALAKFTGCHLIDVWHDNRGPWNDLVGVFNKSGAKPEARPAADSGKALAVNALANIEATEFEKIQGTTPYIGFLERLHSDLAPANYLEIGVRLGKSLSLAKCAAVGVDPDPDITVDLPATTRVVKQTSDDFFDAKSDAILKAKPDLVFIDGMHIIDYVLRDFMNVERIAGPNTVVVVDDVLPNQAEQASRTRETRVWTGDVWKLIHILGKYRPDLFCVQLDTAPTGLIMITGLKPPNEILWRSYNPILREAVHTLDTPPPEILNRTKAIDPSGEKIDAVLDLIKSSKHKGIALREQTHNLRRLLQ